LSRLRKILNLELIIAKSKNKLSPYTAKWGNFLIVQYQRISILPHRRDWNFLGVGGSLRPKNLKKCMEFKWNFQRGGEVLRKIPSVGEVWIFSGSTH